MTAERIKEINQMLEAWQETDTREGDSEKTYVVAELLREISGASAEIKQNAAAGHSASA